MIPSPRCAALVKPFEGDHLTAYQDPRGIWTIGYGHTPAKSGQTITEDQALMFFLNDTATAAKSINTLVSVPLTQNMFDALCSFVFNVGTGDFRGSTLLRLLNEGHYDAAAAQISEWTHGGQPILPGLVERRIAEAELFRKSRS